MKKLILILTAITFILNLLPINTFAYSYGDPGEEAMAEAYKELTNYLNDGDWESANKIYETYQKDFDLYFTKVKPDIERGLKDQNKELVLQSYEAALRLNIERRLHFAEDSFDDYGQAKLLLAKARGTFTVLEPLMVEKKDQGAVDQIYLAFDNALVALGNPGLFGIGSQENDPEKFTEDVNYIINELQPLFPLPSEIDDEESHLTEENLEIGFGSDEIGSSTFWLWFTIGLVALLALLIVINKLKKNKQ
ncbi:hypothetical protein LS684_15790 [Cytobacillus spongiae]|uniref:hypothetical protein n=1 Tax=Cytobacillus spongiae TaxID=2901381 RepID=UPI001F44862A|nr:hypothetical protein [Cytobacillus spongiae]UII55105.1 hypothetical protein LS684_15790 [Cytobacillus spongiae]